MFRTISLALVLFGVWLLFSGHYEPLLLVLGAASCILIAVIAWRMDVVDEEGHPIQVGRRYPVYLLWLCWEIVKANIDVAGRVIGRGPPIGPRVFTVKTSQKSQLGQVIYANSITLTPGTISLRVTRDSIMVHALSKVGQTGLESGEMDRRVARLEADR